MDYKHQLDKFALTYYIVRILSRICLRFVSYSLLADVNCSISKFVIFCLKTFIISFPPIVTTIRRAVPPDVDAVLVHRAHEERAGDRASERRGVEVRPTSGPDVEGATRERREALLDQLMSAVDGAGSSAPYCSARSGNPGRCPARRTGRDPRCTCTAPHPWRASRRRRPTCRARRRRRCRPAPRRAGREDLAQRSSFGSWVWLASSSSRRGRCRPPGRARSPGSCRRRRWCRARWRGRPCPAPTRGTAPRPAVCAARRGWPRPPRSTRQLASQPGKPGLGGGRVARTAG